MPRILAWSTSALEARAAIADRLVAKGLTMAIRPITADIKNIVTAATLPIDPNAPTVAPPPTVTTPTVAMMGMEGITASWNAFVDTELFPYVVQTFMDSAVDIADGLTDSLGGLIAPVGNDYATQYLAQAKNRLVGIGNDLWENARAELVSGMEHGYDMTQMALAVKQAAGVTEPRAMVIARTEVISAANAGSIAQMRHSGFEPGTVTKEWLSTHDVRTRPAHEDADGQSVDLDGSFTVGKDALDFPGDPTGPPGNVINCRCAMAFDFQDAPLVAAKDFDESMVKRDSAGKFAKKAGTKITLPDFGGMENSAINDYITSLTPNQWHSLSESEKDDLHKEGVLLDEIGIAEASNHLMKLDLSDPDEDDDEADSDASDPASVILAITDDQWQAMSDDDKEFYEETVGEMWAQGLDDDKTLSNKIFDLKQKTAGLMTMAEQKVYTDGILDFNADEWNQFNTATQDSFLAKAMELDAGGEPAPLAHLNSLMAGAIAAASPAAMTAGPPVAINTNLVWKQTFGDGAVVAVSTSGMNRIVWDASSKKFLDQTLASDGTWKTTESHTKKSLYDTYKGTSDWHQPVGAAAPTPPAPTTSVATSVPAVTSPIAAPVDPSGFPVPANLKSTGKSLGTHGATVYKDSATGKEWLFKPGAKSFHTSVDIATAEIQELAGLKTPKMTTVKLGGKSGSLQEMVPGKPAFPGTFDASKLTKKELQQLLQQQVLDWFIGNHDSHKGNFVKDANGDIVGIDKGQAFKFYAGDQLSDSFHPNTVEDEPIYNKLWKQYQEGKVDITPEDLNAALATIDKIQNIGQQDLEEILFDYTVGAANAGELLKKYSNGQLKNNPSLIANDGESFLKAVKKRQDSLANDFMTFYLDQQGKKAKKSAPIAAPAPVVATSPSPIVSPGGPGGVSPGPMVVGIADPDLVQFSGLGKSYKGLQLDMTAAFNGPKGFAILDGDNNLLGYLKKDPNLEWLYTPEGGKAIPVSAMSTNLAFAKAGELILAKNPDAGKSTLANPPAAMSGSLPGVYSMPLPTTTTPSSYTIPSVAPTPPSAPSLPSVSTHAKKKLTTTVMYSTPHAHNEVVAISQLGERIIWNANLKKYTHQSLDTTTGVWKHKGYFGKGEAHKKWGKDTHWFAPNASDQITGPTAPSSGSPLSSTGMLSSLGGTTTGAPTLAPSPGSMTPVKPSAPFIQVSPADAVTQQKIAQSGIDVPEELLPAPGAVVPEPPPSVPVIAGLDTDYSGWDIYVKQLVSSTASALPTKDAATNFEGAVKALNGISTPGANLAQVLAYLDSKNVKFGGEANFYTKQITEWLKTPEGKKNAPGIVAKAAKNKSAPGVLPYQKGIDLKPHTIGVPSTTDTSFPGYSPSQLQKMQDTQVPWTSTQSAALKKYTGSAYKEMNGYLRTGVGTEATKKSVENAQKGMRPLPFAILTQRGTDSFFGGAKPTVAQLQAMVGATVRDKGFLSTGNPFGGQYLLEIELPTGTPAAYVKSISQHPGENELLLAAGLKYQILEVKGGTYPTVVRMRVVP